MEALLRLDWDWWIYPRVPYMVRWQDIHVRKATMWMVYRRGHVVKMVAGMVLIQFVGYMVSLKTNGP